MLQALSQLYTGSSCAQQVTLSLAHVTQLPVASELANDLAAHLTAAACRAA